MKIPQFNFPFEGSMKFRNPGAPTARTAAAAIGGVLLIGALAACGSDKAADTPATPVSTTVAAVSSSTAPAPAPSPAPAPAAAPETTTAAPAPKPEAPAVQPAAPEPPAAQPVAPKPAPQTQQPDKPAPPTLDAPGFEPRAGY
ncbi:hypothetical protein [Nocardia aurantiaca]|uniref:hypothetical protein n=1 Tax=Nocardia aurantiaca TaxID=2675850 RepID=UPI0018AA54AC|nr:hypothetical protein [Nocardia aurantiaca]